MTHLQDPTHGHQIPVRPLYNRNHLISNHLLSKTYIYIYSQPTDPEGSGEPMIKEGKKRNYQNNLLDKIQTKGAAVNTAADIMIQSSVQNVRVIILLTTRRPIKKRAAPYRMDMMAMTSVDRDSWDRLHSAAVNRAVSKNQGGPTKCQLEALRLTTITRVVDPRVLARVRGG